MARRSRDEDLLMEDELTAAFLGEDEMTPTSNDSSAAPTTAATEDWEEDDSVPGQLAVDVYETRERLWLKLVLQASTRTT